MKQAEVEEKEISTTQVLYNTNKKDKYDGDKDLDQQLIKLQDFLIEWEVSSQQELIKKLQSILQTIGINPDGDNANEKAEEIKKIQTDLTDLGIDKSNVKEIIENERDEYKAKDQ
ncbi:3937_t:CDS:2 [Entrophospora sp. SA101]|nr:3937_t:CDS:2 [Entrophospora sp. SA101]